MGENNILESCCLKYVLESYFFLSLFIFLNQGEGMIFLSSKHLMRKDHEGFCFPSIFYGIILLTSSRRIIQSQAR